MKSISDMDGNAKVLEFLNYTEKEIIIKLKYKKKQIDIWTNRYLEIFPQFEAKLITNSNSPELPCDHWVNTLIENIDEHCIHCREFHDGRDLSTNETSCAQCLQKYIDFVQYFCCNCTQKPENLACSNKVLKMFQKKMKKDVSLANQHKAEISYLVFCKFDNKDKSNSTFYNFNFFEMILKFTDANSVASVIKQRNDIVREMKDFISNWISIPNNISERVISEVALRIIALHYMFFCDLLNSTFFSNSPEYESKKFVDDDLQNNNVILAYLLKEKGINDSRIMKILNDNVNNDQIVNLRLDNYHYLPKLNNVQILQIMRKITRIYNYPVLENTTIGDLPEPINKLIERLIDDGKISRADVKIIDNAVYRNSDIYQEYLDYIIIIKFVSLLESMKRTRFTNKLPALFEKDDLIKLYKEMKANELDKDPCTLVQACKKLHLKYKTTHMAITEKLRYHPSYTDLIKASDYPDYRYHNYNKIQWFFDRSSITDIEEWIKKVRKLKK